MKSAASISPVDVIRRASAMAERALSIAALAVLVLAAPAALANCTPSSGNLESTPDANLTDNANGTITHSTTNLMWKKCPEGRSYSAGNCTGNMGSYTWQQALRRGVLDTSTGGFSDWRLPSVPELLSIVETGCSTPAINTTRFNMPSGGALWWTSTHSGSSAPDSAWAVQFSNGISVMNPKTEPGYVRLVRNVTDGVHDEYNSAGTEPTPFTFTAQNDVARNTVITSNTVAIGGLTGARNISIGGGNTPQYSINGGAYTSTPGTISAGQNVTVRQTSAPTPSTASTAVLTINGVSSGFRVTTGAIEPIPFAFEPQTGMAVSTAVTSETITLAGISAARAVSIVGGTYSKNGAAFGSGADTVLNGDTVAARLTTSATVGAVTETTLTINGYTFPFRVTTTEPAYFVIPPLINMARNVRHVLSAVQVNGLTASRNATVAGSGTPWHSVGAGATVPANNTSKAMTNGQYLTTSLIAPTTTETTNTATVTINGYAVDFSVSTGIEPTGFAFTDQTNVATSAVITSAPVTIAGLTLQAGTFNPYSIAGGTYSLNGGAFVATAGSALSNGNNFAVRHTAAACPNTTTTTNLTINGRVYPFNSTTVSGPQPTTFSFTNQTNVGKNNTITSAASPALACLPGGSGDISIVGGSYRINAGAYTSSPGTVANGQTVNVQLTSSAANSTPATATLTINGYDFPFTATTGTEPNPVTFPPLTGQTKNVAIPSACVTVTGLTAARAISVSDPHGGSSRISIGCTTTWVTSGTISNNGTVQVRITSDPAGNTQRVATVSIAGPGTPPSLFPFSVTTGP